jgi:hypothetical protein
MNRPARAPRPGLFGSTDILSVARDRPTDAEWISKKSSGENLSEKGFPPESLFELRLGMHAAIFLDILRNIE